jgi:isopentenyl phosphate kinase
LRKPIVVIKLGGSVLTDKKRIYTPRLSDMHRAAEEVKVIMRKYSVVLIHGAGSYGHIPVQKYGLTSGYRDRTQLEGLSTTKSKLLELELVLDQVLLRHGIPIAPLFASDFIATRNGRIDKAELVALRGWLDVGCVPSTGGDIVSDIRTGFAVLSGDQIAAYFAVKLKASRLVFGTDVDGIFDSNPKVDRWAKLLPVLSVSEASRFVRKATSRTTADVTGGMAGKIRESVFAASRGIPVYFINLAKHGRLVKAVSGRRIRGSQIVPS